MAVVLSHSQGRIPALGRGSGYDTTPERIPTRVQDAVAAFLDDLRLQGRHTTAKAYGSSLRLLTPDDQVPDVTTADLRAIFAGRVHEVSLNTVGKDMAVCMAFFGWCREQGIIAISPMTGIKVPKRRRPPHRFLTAGQLRRCLDACTNDKARLIFLLCAGSGLRNEELRALRWQDVDYARHRLRVLGKGQKVREVAFGALVEASLRALEGRQQARGQKWAVDTVLGLKDGSALRYAVESAARRAGVGHVTVHQLRHSFAVGWLTEGEGDLGSLQQLLGHSNAEMSLYYGRTVAAEAALRKAERVDLTGRLFGR